MKTQTKYTYNIVKYIATNPTARSIAIDASKNYISQNPEYVAGRVLTGGIFAFGKSPEGIMAVTGDVTNNAEQIDRFVRGVIYGY